MAASFGRFSYRPARSAPLRARFLGAALAAAGCSWPVATSAQTAIEALSLPGGLTQPRTEPAAPLMLPQTLTPDDVQNGRLQHWGAGDVIERAPAPAAAPATPPAKPAPRAVVVAPPVTAPAPSLPLPGPPIAAPRPPAAPAAPAAPTASRPSSGQPVLAALPPVAAPISPTLGPRSSPAPSADTASVALPQPLSAADAALYRRLFALQRRGDSKAVDQEAAKLADRRLVGHLLAVRHELAGARSTFADLRGWLERYADHPQADAIYEAANKRRPKIAAPLPAPSVERVAHLRFRDDLEPPPEPVPPAGRNLVGEAVGSAATLTARIRERLRAGDLAGAEQLVTGPLADRLLSDGQIDHIKAQIAAGWFAQGDDRKAFELAQEAAQRSGHVVPRANWIAGLALFKNRRYLEAARYFEAMAQIPKGQSWDLAAGAFWAGRAYHWGRRPDLVTTWWTRAAEHPRTFYGMLAIRTAGVHSPFRFDAPALTEADAASLLKSASATRAFALLQVGEDTLAEAELRRVGAGAHPNALRPLLAIATRANMPNLAMRLGQQLEDADGRRRDGALFPIPKWQPIGGFELDPALVFAFMRQESGFNPRAVSPAGARGLMQIMPDTARFVDATILRSRPQGLLDPSLNMTLGQRYIRQLLDDPAVQGDLIRLAAAYNGGPANLARWKRAQEMRAEGTDALLFIESLPSPETRHFITRVLYNYWIYSERLGRDAPSLQAIAAGEWPAYRLGETQVRTVARDARN